MEDVFIIIISSMKNSMHECMHHVRETSMHMTNVSCMLEQVKSECLQAINLNDLILNHVSVLCRKMLPKKRSKQQDQRSSKYGT